MAERGIGMFAFLVLACSGAVLTAYAVLLAYLYREKKGVALARSFPPLMLAFTLFALTIWRAPYENSEGIAAASSLDTDIYEVVAVDRVGPDQLALLVVRNPNRLYTDEGALYIEDFADEIRFHMVDRSCFHRGGNGLPASGDSFKVYDSADGKTCLTQTQ